MKKLTIRRETLRILATGLERVHGGIPVTGWPTATGCNSAIVIVCPPRASSPEAGCASAQSCPDATFTCGP